MDARIPMTCKDCKFFVQGEGRGGVCQKKPYRQSRNGQVYKKPDGTPIEFVTYVGTPACKKYFEKRGSAV
jgi:hypothetical protein